MSDQLRVTLVQKAIAWEDIATNLNVFEKSLEGIGETDLIVLPETFTTGFSMQPEKLAEPTDGKALALMKKMAHAKQAAITGSIIAEENGKYYNRLLWVYPDGHYVIYDKRHLFRMSVENEHYTPGTSRIVVDYKGWRILPLICYDLRFPVWSRNNVGYDMAIYIANWPEPRRHVWNALLTARALENQAYIAGVNRVGTDGKNLSYSGDSRLINARGEVLSQIEPSEEAVETITLNMASLNRFRKKFPVDKDRDAFAIMQGNTYFAKESGK